MAEESTVRRVYERHLDLLLAEELSCRPSFTRWVFERAFGADDGSLAELPSGDPHDVVVQVSDDDSITDDAAGENDLLVEATWADGWTARLLIEDKIDAVVQPAQFERYAARARAHQDLSDIGLARAVVIAPAGYLALRSSDLGTVASISIEDIVAEFREAADREAAPIARRLRWRADQLIGFESSRRVRTPDHPPTVAARDWFLERLAQVEPEALARATTLRTINTGWLYFEDPQAVLYKLVHGYVDIYLRDVWPDDPQAQADAHRGDDHPEGFEPAEDTKGNLILRSHVRAPMPLATIWSGGEPTRPADLLAGAEACGVATRWVLDQRAGGS